MPPSAPPAPPAPSAPSAPPALRTPDAPVTADGPPPGPPAPPTLVRIPPLVALTATARGMVDRDMSRAATQAFTELFTAIARAGRLAQVRSRIGLCPDEPRGPNDPGTRYVAGAVFGHDLVARQGTLAQPAMALSGTLAWWPFGGGRHAVFTHRGPFAMLHRTWNAIYLDWLPGSGEQLRKAAPFEVNRNDPRTTAAADLVTEIWLPLAG